MNSLNLANFQRIDFKILAKFQLNVCADPEESQQYRVS